MSWDKILRKAIKIWDGLPWEAIAVACLKIAAILVVAQVLLWLNRLLCYRILAVMMRRDGGPDSEAGKRAKTLVGLVQGVILVVVWTIAVLSTLSIMKVNIAPLLASAGVVGLAVGFGAQNLVRDLIAGFFMILENHVRVGDVAVVNGKGGLVETLGVRTMTLRDVDGSLHIFPHSSVTTLSNLTRGWSAYVLDIPIPYEADPEQALAAISKVGLELRDDPYFGKLLMDDLEAWGVDAFAESAVILKVRLKTRPIRQWEVGREFRKRVKKALEKSGIFIPYPKRTLTFEEQSPLFGTRPEEREERPPIQNSSERTPN